MTESRRVERRKFHPPMTKGLKNYLRWWPAFVVFNFGIVAYFPPATFTNRFSVNLFSWFAWAVVASGILSLVFPYKLIFRSAMGAFALSRSIAAIATTLSEHDELQKQGLFWAKFWLLNSSLSFTLLWVTMYAVTIPYMKELDHERHR